MGLLLPSELLISLEENCPCRSHQVRQLTVLYNDHYPPPRNLVVYGLPGTGKLHTVISILSARNYTHTVVKTRECLSLRHLLSKIYTACIVAIYKGRDEEAEEAYERRSDSVNALSVNLQRLLQGWDGRLMLVLDGIDKQRGLNPNTLPALARLSDIIPNLYLILIATTPRALFLAKAGIPYLHFPPYTRAEAVPLVARSAPILAPESHLETHQDLPTLQKWYSLFVTTVYDSLFSPTSLSQSHFQRTCLTLWPRFIWPYIGGEQPPGRGKNAQWDFQKLLVRQRALFQKVGEETLAARLLPPAQAMTFEQLQQEQERLPEPTTKKTQSTTLSIPPTLPPPPTPLLPFFPTLLLTASYLASHTPPKLDILLFSRLSSSSRSARVKRSYHRRKLFQSPSKHRADAGAGGGEGPGVSKRKKIGGKAGLEMNLNLPRGFTLERLVAILRAVHPEGVVGGRSVVDRVGREVAELERLRLLVSVDGSGIGGGGSARLDDASGEERKWRVNVPRDFVEELGRSFPRQGLGSVLRDFELLEA